MLKRNNHQKSERGFSLIDALIGLIGLSIITISIVTVNYSNVKMAKYNATNDYNFQIAKSIMEDIKGKLLNYTSNDTLTIIYKSTSQEANQSTVCGDYSDFFCADSNAPLELITLADIANQNACKSTDTTKATETLSDPAQLRIARKSAPDDYFTVKIESITPPGNTTVAYSASASDALRFCKYVRKFRVTVTPPDGNAKQTMVLEAYYPIPS